MEAKNVPYTERSRALPTSESGLRGCFRCSVVWSVCVVRAVCVHAAREIALA